jgi:cell division protein FtsQ
VTVLARLPRAIVVLPRLFVLGPHGRRRLVALAVLLAALGALYMLWLRDSSLVRVTHVNVSGVSASTDGVRVREKLVAAAERMTTLHVDADALRHAVADEPTVHSITVQAQFPHALKISVVENRPVALLVGPGRDVAVSADGSVLAGTKLPSGLPTVKVTSLPGSARVQQAGTLDRVDVAGAAPARLLTHVDWLTMQRGRGVVAQLHDGPVVIFGRPIELAQKWAAAAAVLAQHSSAGATYIDVRMPDRPVAGGLGLQQDPQAQAQAGGVLPAATPQSAAPTFQGTTTNSQQTQAQTPVTGAALPASPPPSSGTTAVPQSQP